MGLVMVQSTVVGIFEWDCRSFLVPTAFSECCKKRSWPLESRLVMVLDIVCIEEGLTPSKAPQVASLSPVLV
jgi:hypothetical protein